MDAQAAALVHGLFETANAQMGEDFTNGLREAFCGRRDSDLQPKANRGGSRDEPVL